jgi:hypothetical protein
VPAEPQSRREDGRARARVACTGFTVPRLVLMPPPRLTRQRSFAFLN